MKCDCQKTHPGVVVEWDDGDEGCPLCLGLAVVQDMYDFMVTIRERMQGVQQALSAKVVQSIARNKHLAERAQDLEEEMRLYQELAEANPDYLEMLNALMKDGTKKN